ncbi:hypothetical protein E2C01_048199 [Portunus trituberculatus]|uniref:Uncharacterized protein n=1 Tax=Portunus trituberculatus TaxID=210409 RepID=A0A5B7G9J8_PORTR|nr:hypothetical protein [Portunus trituberculatus]
MVWWDNRITAFDSAGFARLDGYVNADEVRAAAPPPVAARRSHSFRRSIFSTYQVPFVRPSTSLASTSSGNVFRRPITQLLALLPFR